MSAVRFPARALLSAFRGLRVLGGPPFDSLVTSKPTSGVKEINPGIIGSFRGHVTFCQGWSAWN